VVTYGLIWGAPGWINNQTGIYGPDLLTYHINWLKCARDHWSIDVDWLGLWNERPDNFDYMKQLRKALTAEGFNHTQIVIGDNRRFNAPAVMEQCVNRSSHTARCAHCCANHMRLRCAYADQPCIHQALSLHLNISSTLLPGTETIPSS
jgi:hypothetical protein